MYTVVRTEVRPSTSVAFFSPAPNSYVQALVATVGMTHSSTLSKDQLTRTSTFTWPDIARFKSFVEDAQVVAGVIDPRIAYNTTNSITSSVTHS